MTDDVIIKWRDTTSYSRDDKERRPTTYSIGHGLMKITITCGHIYHRPNYVIHCYAVGIDTKPLTVLDRVFNVDDDIETVKARALEIVESRLDQLRDNLITIKRGIR